MEEFTTRHEEPDGIGALSFVRLYRIIQDAIYGYLMPGTTFPAAVFNHLGGSTTFTLHDGRRLAILLEDCSSQSSSQPGDECAPLDSDQVKPEDS
jgi:hypothetical protein